MEAGHESLDVNNKHFGLVVQSDALLNSGSCGVARGGDTGGSELLSPRLITDSPGTSGSEARHPPPVPPPPRVLC
ncbi:unnamed protein product [Gadus morhua 'NCC']